MTEQQWLAGDDQADKEDFFLSVRARDRKLRLFAIACCRNAWKLLDENERVAASFLETFVEGFADETDRAAVYEHLRRRKASVAQDLLDRDARFSAEASVLLVFGDYHDHEKEIWQLLHEVFGQSLPPRYTRLLLAHPPRPCNVAHLIYDDRAFDCLPILADALEEAGWRQRRNPCPSSWTGATCPGMLVLDLVLGKE